MYCLSCQTKLSPRDKRCPACGRDVATSRDLGAGSSAPADSQANYPLPPAKQSKKSEDDRQQVGDGGKAPDSVPQQGFALPPEGIVELLAGQLSLIEPGLEVYSEDGKASGVGYPTAVGNIDLLARDDAGGWVVIQLAEPGCGKEIVSDLLERIGWVRRHLGGSSGEVRGIVLIDSLPEDLGYAAEAVADTIEFKLYRLTLTFESVVL